MTPHPEFFPFLVVYNIMVFPIIYDVLDLMKYMILLKHFYIFNIVSIQQTPQLLHKVIIKSQIFLIPLIFSLNLQLYILKTYSMFTIFPQRTKLPCIVKKPEDKMSNYNIFFQRDSFLILMMVYKFLVEKNKILAFFLKLFKILKQKDKLAFREDIMI